MLNFLCTNRHSKNIMALVNVGAYKQIASDLQYKDNFFPLKFFVINHNVLLYKS